MACIPRDPQSEGDMACPEGPSVRGRHGLSLGSLSMEETWPVLREPQYEGDMACL